MGNFFKLVGTLTIIAVAASYGLSVVYNATHGITEEYKHQAEADARIEALSSSPDATFEQTTTECVLDGRKFEYFTAYDDGELVGYSFKAYGKGYSSTIETIVGVGVDGTIRGIKITDQRETPGLGAKVLEVASLNTLWAVLSGNARDEVGVRPWFQVQFDGRTPEELVVVKSQAEEGILAITGATISSDAVTNSVRRGLKMMLSTIEGDEAPCESAGGTVIAGDDAAGEATPDTIDDAAGEAAREAADDDAGSPEVSR